MKQPLCLICEHLETEEVEGHYEKSVSGYNVWIPIYIYYSCKKTLANIHTFRKHCRHYSPYTQTKLNIGEDEMVKIDEIPTEAARLDLADLPSEVELIAISEKTIAEQVGKTGGLSITYQLHDGRQFAQKYSKVSGIVLIAALKRLHIKDTTELQNAWYNYKLTPMRIGFPRMIPISKAKET